MLAMLHDSATTAAPDRAQAAGTCMGYLRQFVESKILNRSMKRLWPHVAALGLLLGSSRASWALLGSPWLISWGKPLRFASLHTMAQRQASMLPPSSVVKTANATTPTFQAWYVPFLVVHGSLCPTSTYSTLR